MILKRHAGGSMKPCYLARYQPVKVIKAGRKSEQYKPIKDCSECWAKNNCDRWRERGAYHEAKEA